MSSKLLTAPSCIPDTRIVLSTGQRVGERKESAQEEAWFHTFTSDGWSVGRMVVALIRPLDRLRYAQYTSYNSVHRWVLIIRRCRLDDDAQWGVKLMNHPILHRRRRNNIDVNHPPSARERGLDILSLSGMAWTYSTSLHRPNSIVDGGTCDGSVTPSCRHRCLTSIEEEGHSTRDRSMSRG
jgi:hypothetical protein